MDKTTNLLSVSLVKTKKWAVSQALETKVTSTLKSTPCVLSIFETTQKSLSMVEALNLSLQEMLFLDPRLSCFWNLQPHFLHQKFETNISTYHISSFYTGPTYTFLKTYTIKQYLLQKLATNNHKHTSISSYLLTGPLPLILKPSSTCIKILCFCIISCCGL